MIERSYFSTGDAIVFMGVMGMGEHSLSSQRSAIASNQALKSALLIDGMSTRV